MTYCFLAVSQETHFSNSCQKGLERERSQVKKAFLCTRTMGVSVPSLHREFTDSVIGETSFIDLCKVARSSSNAHNRVTGSIFKVGINSHSLRTEVSLSFYRDKSLFAE